MATDFANPRKKILKLAMGKSANSSVYTLKPPKGSRKTTPDAAGSRDDGGAKPRALVETLLKQLEPS